MVNKTSKELELGELTWLFLIIDILLCILFPIKFFIGMLVGFVAGTIIAWSICLRFI